MKIGSVNRLTVAIGHDDAVLLHGRLELADDPVALGGGGIDRHEVVVVQVDAPGAHLAEHGDGVVGGKGIADGLAKGIATAVADGPEAERELVGGLGLIGV